MNGQMTKMQNYMLGNTAATNNRIKRLQNFLDKAEVLRDELADLLSETCYDAEDVANDLMSNVFEEIELQLENEQNFLNENY